MNSGSLQKVVNNFVEELRALWEQEILDALGGRNGARNGVTVGGSNGHGRGVKRAPEDLEQLGQRFVDFVKANPGLRIEQINKQLGSTTKELALPIRKLVAEKRIKVKGQKRSTMYFAGKD